MTRSDTDRCRQLSEKVRASSKSDRHVTFVDRFGRVMTDAARCPDEQHGRRHVRRKHHRIVAGSARHHGDRRAGRFDRTREHGDKLRVHLGARLIESR